MKEDDDFDQETTLITSHIEKNYGMMMRICISTPTGDPLKIHDAYAQTMALSRQYFFHPSQTIFFPQPYMKLPEEIFIKEEQFIKVLRIGSISEIKKTVGDICLSLQSVWAPEDECFALLGNLIEHYEKHMGQLSPSIRSLIVTFSERLHDFCTIDDYQTAFVSMIDQVKDEVESLKQNRVSNIVESVKQYIDENISGDLSLTILSDLVGLSPNYLSKIFKSTTGQGLATYIINQRMRRAAWLLLNTSHNIERVAEMVGYPTHHNFSRKFKEFYACTPKEYREASLRLNCSNK
jgi:YesN/AraC family two-component response regulator